jgi:hypothetical protein
MYKEIIVDEAQSKISECLKYFKDLNNKLHNIQNSEKHINIIKEYLIREIKFIDIGYKYTKKVLEFLKWNYKIDLSIYKVFS